MDDTETTPAAEPEKGIVQTADNKFIVTSAPEVVAGPFDTLEEATEAAKPAEAKPASKSATTSDSAKK